MNGLKADHNLVASSSSTPSDPRPNPTTLSNVHFLESVSQRGSSSSLKSRPSPPRSPGLPVNVKSTSPIRSPHITPPLDTLSPLSPASPRYPHPDQPIRRSSQDRRVRSEGHALTRAERSGSLLGKRASIVTGGYETSDSDEAVNRSGPTADISSVPMASPVRVRQTMPPSQSFRDKPPTLTSRTRSEEGRRRAMSLITPTMDEFSDRRPRFRPKESSRRASKDPLHLRSEVPRRVSVSRPEIANGTMSETAPSRKKELERLNGATLSNGIAVNGANGTNGASGAGGPSTPDRKGKGKERRVDGLAASLGLDGGASNAALSTGEFNADSSSGETDHCRPDQQSPGRSGRCNSLAHVQWSHTADPSPILLGVCFLCIGHPWSESSDLPAASRAVHRSGAPCFDTRRRCPASRQKC